MLEKRKELKAADHHFKADGFAIGVGAKAASFLAGLSPSFIYIYIYICVCVFVFSMSVSTCNLCDQVWLFLKPKEREF